MAKSSGCSTKPPPACSRRAKSLDIVAAGTQNRRDDSIRAPPLHVYSDNCRGRGVGDFLFAEYAELGNFGMRVVMSYQPNTLAQQFTVDILYGCGVLRNTAGVQVNT